MDRLHFMTVFVAVAENESFSGAARKLGISAPSVTRAITALETRLNVKLLHRTTRSVRVTEAGQLYLEVVRRIIHEVNEADSAASGVNAEPRGRLTVTAPVQFGKMFITPSIVEYLQRYTEMEVSAIFLDRIVNLLEEGVDIGIRIGDLPDSSMKAIRVGQVRRVLCASPEYLAQNPEPQIPTDLAQHAIVVATTVTPTLDWKFRQGMTTTHVRIKPRLSVSSIDAALEAVAHGFGITRLLSYQVTPYTSIGKLKILLIEFEPTPLPIHVIHREGQYVSAKVRTFIDLVVANLRANKTLH
jgi:DNA-binding transcriptional LysR family regulator